MRAGRLAVAAVLVAALLPWPAAPLSRQYLCFFDPGSAELSPRCQLVAQEFAAWWHKARRGEDHRWPEGTLLPATAMRVEITGHADAAEAAAGKASISEARAEATAAFLRLHGVPAAVIKTTAFGAGRLLVPTNGADPQNRRVELYAR